MSSTDNNCISKAHIKMVTRNLGDSESHTSNLTIEPGQVVNIYGSTIMHGSHNSVVDSAIITTNLMQIIRIFNDQLTIDCLNDQSEWPSDNISGRENFTALFPNSTHGTVDGSSYVWHGTQDITINDLYDLGTSVDNSLNVMEGKTLDIFGFSMFDNASDLRMLGGSHVFNLTQTIDIGTKRIFTIQDYKRWSKLVGISDFKYFQGANDFCIDKGDFTTNRIPNATGSPFSDAGNIRISGFNAFEGAHDFVINDIDVIVNCIQSVFINHRPFLATAVNTVRFGKEYIPSGVNIPASPRPQMLLEQLARGRGDPNDILNTIPGHVKHLTHHDVLTSGSVNYYNIYHGPVDQGDTFNGDIHGSAAGGRHSVNSLNNTGPSARDTELDDQLKETEEKLAKYEKLLKAKEDLQRLEIRLKGMSGNPVQMQAD